MGYSSANVSTVYIQNSLARVGLDQMASHVVDYRETIVVEYYHELFIWIGALIFCTIFSLLFEFKLFEFTLFFISLIFICRTDILATLYKTSLRFSRYLLSLRQLNDQQEQQQPQLSPKKEKCCPICGAKKKRLDLHLKWCEKRQPVQVQSKKALLFRFLYTWLVFFVSFVISFIK
jgi:hypothetical protein